MNPYEFKVKHDIPQEADLIQHPLFPIVEVHLHGKRIKEFACCKLVEGGKYIEVVG